MKQRQGKTVEWTAQSSVDTAQSIRRPLGKKREFKVILGLMFVSFGFYTLWYHWVAHRELCDFLGRPAREWPIWLTHVMLLGVALGIIGSIVMLRLGGSRAGGTGAESVLAVSLALVLITMGAVYLVYVRRQFQVIREAKERLGLPSRVGVGRFFLFPGAFGYWALHEEYLEIWWHVEYLRRTSDRGAGRGNAA